MKLMLMRCANCGEYMSELTLRRHLKECDNMEINHTGIRPHFHPLEYAGAFIALIVAIYIGYEILYGCNDFADCECKSCARNDDMRMDKVNVTERLYCCMLPCAKAYGLDCGDD